MPTISPHKLQLNKNNPRFIKDDKFAQLVKSIKAFPEMLDKRPIVVNEDMVVLGGNMRLRACREAGLKEIPYIIAEGWTEAWALSPAKVAYVWHASYFTITVGKSLEACAFGLRYLIIWAKDVQVFGRGHYHWKHEPCWMGVKDGQTADWIGDRKQTTVWDIPTINSFKNGNNAEEWGLNGVHSTQKPVECMARPMRNHAGDVYDPFGGSGTTMVAAQQLDRTCYMIELEPKYCQLIINRMRNAFPELEVKINGVEYNG